MVTRCVEALDRLEEVSQQIYKKSSIQERIKKVESILNQQAKKKLSTRNGRKKIGDTRITIIKSKASHCLTARNIPSAKRAAQTDDKTNEELNLKQGKRDLETIRKETSRGQSQTSRMYTSKPPDNLFENVVDHAALKRNPSPYIAEERTPEPLCWQEQLNSSQVKVISQKQVPVIHHDDVKCDSHPVVFHDKKWIKEMLLRRPAQFRISPCFLPNFQQQEKTKTSKCQITSGKRITENVKDKRCNKLELRGKGVPLAVSNLRQLIFDDIDENVSRTPNNRSRKDYTMLTITNESQEHVNGTNAGNCHTISQLVDGGLRVVSNTSATKNLMGSTKQHVDISVCVPNADYTGVLADDCRSVIRCVTYQSNNTDVELETPYHGEDRISNTDSQNYSTRPDIGDTETIVENHTTVSDETKQDSAKYKRIASSSSSLDLLRRKSQPSGGLQRSSSRIVYTPSSPPLFLSDQVIELPRSASPVKALMELRQNFCENIRKEAKQLEFDLQELYLKKHLHER